MCGDMHYHIAFGVIFNSLDDSEPLFESHLLDDVCPYGAKLLHVTELTQQFNISHLMNYIL